MPKLNDADFLHTGMLLQKQLIARMISRILGEGVKKRFQPAVEFHGHKL